MYYVYCDPSSEVYQNRLVELVDKINDCNHDVISIDIWLLDNQR